MTKKKIPNCDNKQMYVGALKIEVDENDLKNYFIKFGNVIKSEIIKDWNTFISRGFGFVTFDNSNSLHEALSINLVFL